jgi:hypothetical protein
MKRIALVLVASSLWAGSLAAEPPKPLIEAMLRVPVLQSVETHGAADPAKPLTGDEAIDTLSMLSATGSPAITSSVRDRVMARLAGQPEILREAIDILPDTPAAAAAASDAFAARPRRRLRTTTGGSTERKICAPTPGWSGPARSRS